MRTEVSASGEVNIFFDDLLKRVKVFPSGKIEIFTSNGKDWAGNVAWLFEYETHVLWTARAFGPRNGG